MKYQFHIKIKYCIAMMQEFRSNDICFSNAFFLTILFPILLCIYYIHRFLPSCVIYIYIYVFLNSRFHFIVHTKFTTCTMLRVYFVRKQIFSLEFYKNFHFFFLEIMFRNATFKIEYSSY